MFVALAALALVYAGEPTSLTVTVSHPDGRIASDAWVRLVEEGRRRRVHASSGSFMTFHVVESVGGETELERGSALTVDVWAPGSRYIRARIALDMPHNLVHVVLPSMDLTLSRDASQREQAALAAARRWVHSSDRYLRRPGGRRLSVLKMHRRAAAAAALLWLDQGTADSRALEVCRATASAPGACD